MLALLLALVCGAPVQEVTVEATGVAALAGDERAAAARALLEAQRAAVEQGAGVLLHSETEARDSQLVRDLIQTKATGYLARYETIERTAANGEVRITIRAVVKLAPLAGDLFEIEAVADRLGRPRFGVALTETLDGRPAEPLAATELRRLLLERGFGVVDEGAEMIVMGRVDVTVRPGPARNTFTGGATAMVAATEVWTTRHLADRSLEIGARPELPGYTAFDRTGAAAGAARRAAEALLLGDDGLLGQLLAAWLTRPTMLTLVVTNLPPGRLHALLDALRDLAGVDSVEARSLAAGRLVVTIEGPARREDLIRALADMRTADGRLNLTAIDGTRITASVTAP